jgi:segregation and condensation protein B
MNQVNQHIEALIFCSEQSLTVDEIGASLKITFDWELSDEEILHALEEIKAKYQSTDFAFELMEIADGFQFLTKKAYHATVSGLIQHKAKKKLSTSAMETLAIIAYKQPITKAEVEHIRGVNCDYAVQKLLEKELIEINGKSDAPGKPLVYVTSKSFMDYFGIKTVKDLPQLKDLHVEQNEIGQPAEYSETEETFIADIATESEFVSEDVVIVTNVVIEEELVSFEDDIAPTDLPDRKSIFLEQEENKSSIQNEISSDESEENLYDAPRD